MNFKIVKSFVGMSLLAMAMMGCDIEAPKPEPEIPKGYYVKDIFEGHSYVRWHRYPADGQWQWGGISHDPECPKCHPKPETPPDPEYTKYLELKAKYEKK